MALQISERVCALAKQAQGELREQFERIDTIAEENTQKVLSAFQKHRVAESYFAGTTGYGYDDLGRTSWMKSTQTFLAQRTRWCVSSSSTAPMPSPVRCLGR